MGKKSFIVDVDKCSGCQLCVVACKDEHVGHSFLPWTKPQPDTGHFWVKVGAVERGRIPRVKMSYLPLLCQHCENAPCIKACPEGAITRRDDGLVWIDPATCNGCGQCQSACPYDVIYMNKELDIAQKCTGCAHRVDEGLAPRCVDVCPHDAIVFRDAADAALGDVESDQALEIYHPEYYTEPTVLWKGLPKPWIAGTVVDAERDVIIAGATIKSVDLFEEGTVTVLSDDFGDFWIKGMKDNRKYKVEVTKVGYQPFHTIVTTDGDQDLGVVSLKAELRTQGIR